MSDFFQHGLISTLHRLVDGPIAGRIDLLPATDPVDLLLPCHYSEIGTPALDRIIDCLRNVSFLSSVVISMNGIPDHSSDQVKRFWSRIERAHVILQNDSPSLLKQLRERGLSAESAKNCSVVSRDFF